MKLVKFITVFLIGGIIGAGITAVILVNRQKQASQLAAREAAAAAAERTEKATEREKARIAVAENIKLRDELNSVSRENAMFKQQMFNAQRSATVPTQPAQPTIQRLTIPGNRRRDVYGAPQGGIIGKVDAGSVLQVLDAANRNGVIWYAVQLERGSMYTMQTENAPSSSLTRGWLPALNGLEAK